MTVSRSDSLRRALLATSALLALGAGAAHAQTAPQTSTVTAADAGGGASVEEIVVTNTRTTRSAVALAGPELQKILPGVNALKAIQTLPGVLFETADPWGNNEQNEALFVHGFSTQQLGYTLDHVPLGDQQYGNYNGLSPSRALTSENVGRVVLSSGAGNVGVASTSNLGGSIETFSTDPLKERTVDVRETLGSYSTTRTFIRLDTGTFAGLGGDNALYVSGLHHDARAWDFQGHQIDNQVNLKFVHDGPKAKLTLFADWDDKVEPNEDNTAFGNQQTAAAAGYTPYTRPFIFPNTAACVAYVAPSAANGNLIGSPPIAAGNNFTNCFSAAQRTDVLTYAKLDYKFSDTLTWSNQAYYHYNYGRGIVAGPINQAGLPTLFSAYFPGLVVGGSATSAGSLQNLANLFGGTGYEVRTTEYRINREGELSTLNWNPGNHQIEAGLWYEHNEPAQHRVWYPFSAANNDLSPYTIPKEPSVFTQYYFQFHVDDVQLHLEDQWRIIPSLVLQASWKASLQTANDAVPIEQKNLPTAAVPVVYPVGKLTSNDWFLPQVGAVWDATSTEQLFFNVQKNMRQFITYGAGSGFNAFSPYSLGTQAAFDLFKSTVKPETSWTYEAGARTHHSLDNAFLTGVEGQASFYHVNFANRLLNVAPYSFINPAPAILVNVGGVTTNGVDIAGTLHFGPHFSFYDALSYNRTTYDSSYSSGISNGVPIIVATAGKVVPLTPDWLNKFIASTTFGSFEAQLNGDYIGKRYVTYLNDLSVPTTFELGLEASYRFQIEPGATIKSAKLSVNVTNLTDLKGISTANVTSTSGGYTAYPLSPRMFFVTVQATF
jgi:outer membrane receptor protein involved in Fe transport